jgi:hypothetical protein
MNNPSLLVQGLKTIDHLLTAPKPTGYYPSGHPTLKHPNCLISLVFGKPRHIESVEKLKKTINFPKSPYPMSGMT